MENYLIPYLIAQLVGVAILILAIKRPGWARWFFAVLFFAAGVFNWYTSVTNPLSYLGFADHAVPLYRTFILGWFSRHVQLVIPLVATGQLLIATGLVAGGCWLAAACLGIILFLMAIAPLGIGSAFPFSILVSVAAYLVFRHWQLPLCFSRRTA